MVSGIHTEVENGKMIQYLRLDIVKEREARLIDAAFVQGLNDIWIEDEEVYEAAGIEELK